MYQPLSPIDHSSYYEQQSDRKFKKRSDFPGPVQKSPNRQCENRSILANRPFTPSKKIMPNGSPLKSISSITASNVSRPREMAPCSIKKSRMSNQPTMKQSHYCQNHPSKTARYVIQTQDEQIPYCQKCSILLASQGFKVVKLDQPFSTAKVESSFSIKKQMVQLNDLQRQNQLNYFLQNLQTICTHLKSKKGQVQSKINIITQSSQDQIQSIQTYFQQLWQVVQQYKLNMIVSVTKHQDIQMQPLRRFDQQIDECLQDAQLMKQDILSSLQIIQQVQDKMFRKVMQSYKSRQQSFKDQLIKPTNMIFNPLKIVFLTQSHKMQNLLHDLADFKSNQSRNSEYKRPVRQQNHSMSSQSSNPIIQQSSQQQNLLKNNISNNESYFKQFE